MRPGQWLVLTALLCCSSFAHGAPQLPGAHTEKPSMPYFDLLTCDKEGLIQGKSPIVPPSPSTRAPGYDIITAPDRRSALVKNGPSTTPVAALVRCKDGRTTAIELHRSTTATPQWTLLRFTRAWIRWAGSNSPQTAHGWSSQSPDTLDGRTPTLPHPIKRPSSSVSSS